MGRFNIISLVALVLLTACSSLSRQEPPKIACPEIYILKDTDRVARFLPDGEKPSIKNLVFEARSTFGDGTCTIKNGKLSLKLLVGAYVKTAPIFADEKAQDLNQELEMYVGVRNKAGQIINRKAVVLELQKGEKGDDGESTKGTPLLRAFFSDKSRYDDLFPKDLLRVSSPVEIDIATIANENPTDYKIYLGFRITESELRFNRNGYLPSF